MRTLAAIGAALETAAADDDAQAVAEKLLGLGEEVLEHWIAAKGEGPTDETREGFRLLALHRQGAKGDPSFNACRETCRELAWHYNLVTMRPDDVETTNRLQMMKMVCRHLYLFVSGKMQIGSLGEFCCSSRPIRLADPDPRQTKEA
jgi:hypothetical protein